MFNTPVLASALIRSWITYPFPPERALYVFVEAQ